MDENRSKARLVQQPPTLGESAPPSTAGQSTPMPGRAALHGIRRHKHVEEQLREGDGEVVLPQSVYQMIMEHLSSDTGRELGGLLVGTETRDAGRPTILIQNALPARHTRSHQTRLIFTEDTWVEFNRELDALESQGVKLQRVGWYHSHPNMGIFLSPWDLDVCREFRRPTQVALVVDPVEPKGGFFVRGPEGFREHAPQGFWEMQDMTSDSVVRWNNVTPQQALFLGGLAPSASVPGSTSEPGAPRDAKSAEPLFAPPPPPQPPERPRYHWLLAAAMLAATLLGAVAGWGFGRRAWGEDREAVLRKHTEELARLSGWVQELNDNLAALQKKEPPALPTTLPNTTEPAQPAAEPTPVPQITEILRPAPTGRSEVTIRRSRSTAPPHQATAGQPPSPRNGGREGAPSPEAPEQATNQEGAASPAAQETVAPAPSPAPDPETPTPAPAPEAQNPADASPQPASAAAPQQGTAPAPQAPAPAETPTPEPVEKKPPSSQSEAGSHQVEV